MQADGNSFPVFILGWTIGGSARASRAVSSALARKNQENVFDEGVEHDSRGGRAPHSNRSSGRKSAQIEVGAN